MSVFFKHQRYQYNVLNFTVNTSPIFLVQSPFTLIVVSHELFCQLLSYDHSISWLKYFYKNVKIGKFLRLYSNLDC